jgi:KaiC/GvpD/RAD55 family RecA-like ATPase
MTMETNSKTISFGIPSLDHLLNGGLPVESPSGATMVPAATSICLVGPEGTGKSILALHLAATYAATAPEGTKLVYVSTDLPFRVAWRYWEQFGLRNPGAAAKQRPFLRDLPHAAPPPRPGEVSLDEASPIELAARLSEGKSRSVIFLDLRSHTAGDDWGLLNRLIAVLPSSSDEHPHMVVVDAVDGLEMLSGHQDPHGEARSLRARLAQVLRTAQRCHVAFVVGAESAGSSSDVAILSDLVVRLRTVQERNYTRRTLEIEKARGASAVRGQHQYYIRDGAGSSTGRQDNPDDPPVHYPDIAPRSMLPRRTTVAGQSYTPLAYVHVARSTHQRYREAMSTTEDPNRDPVVGNVSGFGIKYLDDLLGVPSEPMRGATSEQASEPSFGWPAGRVSMLMGQKGTLKSHLGAHFLASGFASDATSRHGPTIGVLLTNRDETHVHLASRIERVLRSQHRIAANAAELEQRIICRRLEVHDMTAAGLSHIVASTIDHAEHLWTEEVRSLGKEDELRFADNSWRVRLIVDDWSILRGMYVDLRADDLFLPFLVFHLNRKRISSLIIASQPVRPHEPPRIRWDHQLQLLADRALHTWHVPFFGNSRVAITHLPGTGNRGGVVRELRLQEDELVVDPHFEMYEGLEAGEPRLVPLRVRLIGQTPAQHGYGEDVERFFRSVFFPPMDGGNVIEVAVSGGYDVQRALLYLQSDRRLDHALVLQIDEAWAIDRRRTKRNGLHDLTDYLIVACTNPESASFDRFADPFAAYVPSQGAPRSNRRVEFFASGGDQTESVPSHQYDRVPYVWDFGFLLLRLNCWRAAAAQPLPSSEMGRKEDQPKTVGDVLERLLVATDFDATIVRALTISRPPGLDPASTEPTHGVSWRDFLLGCTVVARTVFLQGAQEPVPAFDLDLTPESFSSLILEVWASEIADSLQRDEVATFVRSLAHRHEEPVAKGLVGLLCEGPSRPARLWKGYRLELYRAWMLVIEALRYTPFQELESTREFSSRAAATAAVAARHGYATASARVASWNVDDPLVPARLPGRFSVRGDWSLAIPNASRSKRLAERAIDVLTSQRAVEARLRLGIGLPVRGIGSSSPEAVVERLAPTSLYTLDKNGSRRPLHYDELLRIAARNDCPRARFNWLWRSQLESYADQARVWQRWLHETMVWLRSVRKLRAGDWRSGFEIYERADSLHRDPHHGVTSFKEFDHRCEYLVSSLTRTMRTSGLSVVGALPDV